MSKIRLAVLCPSEIAFRRFMPSLLKNDNFEYVGIAVANEEEWGQTVDDKSKIPSIIESELEKAKKFTDAYGGMIYSSYAQLISDESIDAVYLPLPPGLHYLWGKKVIESKKHLLMEKPFTVKTETSKELIDLARENNVAVHENYMFIYHSQLDFVKKTIEDGTLGEIRNIRAAFTFPMRGVNDFRYVKALGGGALLDCAGYPVRLMSELMGDVKVAASRLHYIDNFEVDFYGNATLYSDKLSAQIIFGMDNTYKCELEVQGSKALLYTDRIFTAPDDFKPTMVLKSGNDVETYTLESDGAFLKSINRFYESIINTDKRNEMFSSIIRQAELIEQIKE